MIRNLIDALTDKTYDNPHKDSWHLRETDKTTGEVKHIGQHWGASYGAAAADAKDRNNPPSYSKKNKHYEPVRNHVPDNEWDNDGSTWSDGSEIDWVI